MDIDTQSAKSPMPSMARNVLWNWVTLAVGIAVTFVLSPFVVRTLGEWTYGLWVLLGSLVGYLGLLDLGVRGAVTRYVAKLHAQGAHEEASRLVSTALTIFGATGLTAIVLAVLAAAFLLQHFHIQPAQIPAARIVICVGGLTVAVTLLGATFGGVVCGLQRFDTSSQIEIAVNLLRACGVYLALRGGMGIVALAVIQLAVSLGVLGANALVARRLYPGMQLRIGSWDSQAFRTIASYGSSATLLVLAASIIFYSDSVVIGIFLPVASVTLFSMAGNLIEYSRNVLRGISTAVTPRVSALGLHGTGTIARSTLATMRIATLLLLPVMLTFIIRGGSFLGLWMGPQFAEVPGHLLVILTLGQMLMGGSHIVYSSLLGMNRHRGMLRYTWLQAAVTLLLSVILVQRVGLTGVAWATTLPNMAMSLVTIPWYAQRNIGIPWTAFYWNTWLRPFASSIPFAVGTACVERFWPATSLAGYFAGVLAVLPLAAAGAWIIGLDRDERAWITASVQGRFRPRRALDPLG